MLRALILAALICVCGILASSSAAARTVNRQTPTPIHHSNAAATTSVAVNMTPQHSTTITNKATASTLANNDDERYHYYHPAEDKKPHLIDQFHHQHPDGTYEFKYVVSNGVTRYEKSYWKHIGKGKKILARKGFYSHPLSDGRYLTVFYTADEHGFKQDTAKYSSDVPTLPKHLDIPQMEYSKEVNKPHLITTTTPYTTRRTTTTTRRTTTTTTPRTTTTTPRTTTRKPRSTTSTRPLMEPTQFNWIY
ncbi:hypothetical protein DOY81_007413 [Sarcophaga bullata]|nr:hypothetical protein DOY81_007413 [Sarcophaga bullata]